MGVILGVSVDEYLGWEPLFFPSAVSEEFLSVSRLATLANGSGWCVHSEE